jgi:hypothetical protein
MPPPSSVTDIAPPLATSQIAAKGFAIGALRFGSISILSHILLQATHPVYRRVTIQFKVFIQIAALTLGGVIFAEREVSDYNDMLRRRRRAFDRSQKAWSETQEMIARQEAREMMEAQENAQSKEE